MMKALSPNCLEDTVFVFGSNLAGIHDSGAGGQWQHNIFAAVKGVGRGWAGQSFVIQHSMNIYSKCHYHKLSIT